MRLTEKQIQAITGLCKTYFGAQSSVKLFGSRVYDEKKGGDIDLLLSAKDQSLLTMDNKIKYLVDLKRIIGDQRIDVVFDNKTTRMQKHFYESILEEAVQL